MTAESPEQVTAHYLAEACHELRTPVAVLSLVIDLVPHADRLSPERLAAILATVCEQTATLRVLVDRYLEHGLLVNGSWRDEGIVMDVAVEVAAALDSIRLLVPSERVRRQLAAAHVVGDVGRVRSVVTNLVLNAARYSQDAPVDVQVREDGAQVVLHVADHGMGIPAPDRERIMQPFRRGTNAVDQAVAGAGLGLAIVAAHLEALGGQIDLSDRDGGGTVVTVRLPAYEQGSDPVHG